MRGVDGSPGEKTKGNTIALINAVLVILIVFFISARYLNGNNVPSSKMETEASPTETEASPYAWFIPKTCEELAPHIIELKKENPGFLNVLILKMYDIEEISSEGTERVLNCLATAQLNIGERVGISFYITEDEDGDYFQFYEFQ